MSRLSSKSTGGANKEYGMREVIAGRLWLGNTMDAHDIGHLVDTGIQALVQLAIEELPPTMTRDILYFRFPLTDGSGNQSDVLAVAVETVASLIEKRIPAMVFCSAGMSRSPVIVAATMALIQEQSPDECLAQIVSGHPRDVSASFWNSVITVYNEKLCK